ncbi:MAG: hypothetical protein J7J02_07605 [Sulfurovum sp.]|nr:hypothetical protein [Sulfurovum sp.]
MKKNIIFIFCTVTVLLLAACGEETKKSSAKGIENPVDTYMNSRMDAMDMARQSVKKNNKQMEEQDKAAKALLEK